MVDFKKLNEQNRNEELIEQDENDQKKNELFDFIDSQMLEIETERKGALAEKGYAPFLKLEIGETKLVLMPMIPRVGKGWADADRMIFRVQVNGEDFDWGINPRSPMYVQLLGLLRKAPTSVTVIRLGEGKNTRYDLRK